MTTETTYCISINGQSAVDAGYALCIGACYKVIQFGDGCTAQLEVTIDDEGEYNGFPCKWVDVSFIKNGRSIPELLDWLARVGFSGCRAFITKETDNGCTIEAKKLCGCYI